MITDKFLFDKDANSDDDDKKSMGSIGSDEAVMFVNPCNYTLDVDEPEEDDGRERSAFDPDVIEEDSSLLKDKPSVGSRDELYR